MEKDYLVLAIKSLRPTAEFSYFNDDYSTIKWDVLEGVEPTLKELELEIDHLKKLEAQSELDKANAKAELLTKLGITADEAALLLS
jgi:hypothetical protein